LAADFRTELDRQVETLIRKGYPEDALAALRQQLPEARERGVDGRIPFVIVVKTEVISAARAIQLVELGGKQGFTDMADLDRFVPIGGIEIPDTPAYLVIDVDTGTETLNVTPDDALESIMSKSRSPLTIDEGLALVTQYPEVLESRNAFSILGSRCGDRRVPALWLSKGRPRLGWCWAGNPHTWLGSASCAGRA
jgi:hypothetical protein